MKIDRSSLLRSGAFPAVSAVVIAALAALGSLALPTAAHATKVIAIQVYADPAGSGGEARYGVAPENEAVPVTAGEHLRLTLIGSALIDGKGKEVRINASFEVAAGDVQIVGRGSDWVDVVVGRGDNGVAGQIGYRVTEDYEMRGGFQNGRITLQIQRSSGGQGDHGGGGSQGGDSHGGRNSSRQEKATTVTRALIEGILNTTFDARRDSDWVDEVYDGGYDGVRSVADNLARQAARRGSSDEEATVRRLYRTLLRRNSDQIESDEGFWNNVKEMRKSGLQNVVATIVTSAEFSRAFRLDDFDAR